MPPQTKAASGKRRKKSQPSGTVKRSVTIREDLDKAAREVLDDRGFSALVNEGLEWAVQHRNLMSTIQEYEAEHGAITKHESSRALADARAAGRSRR